MGYETALARISEDILQQNAALTNVITKEHRLKIEEKEHENFMLKKELENNSIYKEHELKMEEKERENNVLKKELEKLDSICSNSV